MPKREAPTVGLKLFRNGKLYARVESTQPMIDGKMYYTIRRYIASRQAWSKSTCTYAWQQRD